VLRKLTTVKKFAVVFICFIIGCTTSPHLNNQLADLQGKNIDYVLKGFNFNPDAIEVWQGYQRYSWHICKNTGQSVIAKKDDNTLYYKPEIKCCNAVFDVNWDNKIVSYNKEEISYCPIDLGFKK